MKKILAIGLIGVLTNSQVAQVEPTLIATSSNLGVPAKDYDKHHGRDNNAQVQGQRGQNRLDENERRQDDQRQGDQRRQRLPVERQDQQDQQRQDSEQQPQQVRQSEQLNQGQRRRNYVDQDQAIDINGEVDARRWGQRNRIPSFGGQGQAYGNQWAQPQYRQQAWGYQPQVNRYADNNQQEYGVPRGQYYGQGRQQWVRRDQVQVQDDVRRDQVQDARFRRAPDANIRYNQNEQTHLRTALNHAVPVAEP